VFKKFYTIGFATSALALTLAGTPSCASTPNSAPGYSTKADQVSEVHETKIGTLNTPSAGSVIGADDPTVRVDAKINV